MSDPDSPQDIERLLQRLRRIKGQLDGVETMIENEEYCIDLINQIHSVERALQGLSVQIMEDHLKGCVRDAIDSSNSYEEQEKLDEFIDVVSDYLKK